MLPLKLHQAYTSPKSRTVAVALPNQSLSLSESPDASTTLWQPHTPPTGYPWSSSARPSFSFSSTLAVPPTPPSTIAGPRRSTPAAAQKGSFGLYGLSPGSLFHSGGFGPEVVPQVGLTCFVEQCAAFDALPVAFSSRLARIQRVGSLGQNLIPAANEARAAVLLDYC